MIDAGWFPYRTVTMASNIDGIRCRRKPRHSWVEMQPFLVAPWGILRDRHRRVTG